MTTDCGEVPQRRPPLNSSDQNRTCNSSVGSPHTIYVDRQTRYSAFCVLFCHNDSRSGERSRAVGADAQHSGFSCITENSNYAMPGDAIRYHLAQARSEHSPSSSIVTALEIVLWRATLTSLIGDVILSGWTLCGGPGTGAGDLTFQSPTLTPQPTSLRLSQ